MGKISQMIFIFFPESEEGSSSTLHYCVCVTFEITSEQLLSFRSLLFIYIVASSI